MGIRLKLMTNAVILTICLLMVGGVGYFSTDRVARLSMDLFQDQALPIIRIDEVEKASWEYMVRMIAHGAAAEPEAMEQLEAEMASIKSDLAARISRFQEVVTANRGKDEAADVDAKALVDFQKHWDVFVLSAEAALKDSRDLAKEDALSRMLGEGKTAFNAALATLRKAVEHHEESMTVHKEDAMSGRRSAGVWIIVLTTVAILCSFLGAGWILQSLAAPLNQVIQGLRTSSDSIDATAKQVSSAGQTLAEGSSQQAASVEETSSSLEEMASMVRQNSNNAKTADTLMKAANDIVHKADRSMGELTTSMDQISKASEETFKINKTIDEIAFQTNLLALNAAVEAARAGEAGAGFAVVADEVRNLALRATEAAKSTAALIEGNVKLIKDGVEVVERTDKDFDEVTENARKVGELISEIASASDEQAQGIEQLNAAVSEMDKVIQSNTANAEETASASEEMKRQASELKGFVNALTSVVRGGARNNGKVKPVHEGLPSKRKAATPRNYAAPKSISPKEIIPFDNNDFEDF